MTRRNINNLRYADDTTLVAEIEEELKSLLMRVKKLPSKSPFKKLGSWIWIHYLCQIEGGTVEEVTDFIFLGSKITLDSDRSHEIKRSLLLEKKAVTNLNSILKIRDVTLPSKVHTVKTIAFSAVTYGCESWIIKKAEY